MLDSSPVQIILVLAIALLVLGPKRLPGMAKSLGHGLRGFRDSLAGHDDPVEHPDETIAVATTDRGRDDRTPVSPRPAETTYAKPTAVNDSSSARQVIRSEWYAARIG